jgi:hypothetical protein
MAIVKVVKVGRTVETSKGCRYHGAFRALVVSGPAVWRTYKAWMVKKGDGKVVRCLDQNLSVVA